LQADLVVWGETAVGDFSLDLDAFKSPDQVQSATGNGRPDQQPCPGLNCPLLCGGCSFGPGHGQTGPYFNTAFLIAADETILGRYHKRVLMPWGEYAVGQQWIPGLRNLLADVDLFAAGNSAEPLSLPGQARVGVLICYEDILPWPARQTVLEGADLLVNLNNLEIFGRTAALLQHQQLARFRTIENRRWLVRCGSTGSTAVISSTGRVVRQAPTHTATAIVEQVPRCDCLTFYTVLGDWFAWLCFAATSFVVALSCFTTHLDSMSLDKPCSRILA